MENQLYGKLGESGKLYDKPYRTPQGYIRMTEDQPTPDHVAQAEGTWAIPEEKIEELYQAEMNSIDPMLNHYRGHIVADETERAARAKIKYLIARAEVKEKYGKGSTVLVTETGSCYHKSSDCSALANSTGVKEINKSDGLKNYSPCSVCCN